MADDSNEYRGQEASYSCPWMVIFPRGNRRLLDIAQVRDYEKDEWALASARTFVFEYDARDYMVELSEKHNIRCEIDGQQYLD